MKVNIIFQNIQLLACFFFWTSSTSNLYLAIQSSCRKRKREVRRLFPQVSECRGRAHGGLPAGCTLCEWGGLESVRSAQSLPATGWLGAAAHRR